MEVGGVAAGLPQTLLIHTIWLTDFNHTCLMELLILYQGMIRKIRGLTAIPDLRPQLFMTVRFSILAQPQLLLRLWKCGYHKMVQHLDLIRIKRQAIIPVPIQL